MLNKTQKQVIITELEAVFNGAQSTVLIDTLGTSSNDLVAFRKIMRDADVGVKTVHNKLVKRFIKDTSFAALEPVLVGPCTLLWSDSEPGKPAKTLEALLENYTHIDVKGLCLGGELLQPARLKEVAKLPSKHEALTILARTLKAPISKFATVLNQVPTGLAIALTAVKDQKSAA